MVLIVLKAKEKEIELKDLDDKKIKLLSNDDDLNQKEIKQENEQDIKLEVKESKNKENIPEIEIIELLNDIKLNIEKGDLIGIVGPIGAGKHVY